MVNLLLIYLPKSNLARKLGVICSIFVTVSNDRFNNLDKLSAEIDRSSAVDYLIYSVEGEINQTEGFRYSLGQM